MKSAAIVTSLFVGLLSSLAANAVEISFEEDHSLPLVNLNVAIKTGAVSDPKGQYGLTNFMGEMLLRGTRLRNKEQIDLALDQMGARLEVEIRPETMVMRGTVLRSQLEPFLNLVNEIATQPSFPENEIKKLKSEVISAILEELGQDSSLASRRFNRFLFTHHPYGKPALGTVKDIQNLNRAQIVSHYDRIIRDQGLLVLGTGDAQTGMIEKWGKNLAETRTRSMEKKGIKAADPLPEVIEPKNADAQRLIIVDKPDRTQTQIFGGQIGLKLTDDKFFPLFIGNHAFGGGSFSARMFSEIRVKRGWSYGAVSRFQSGRQPRSWFFYLFPASKDTADALAYSLKMVSDLKENGITPEEFAFAKQSRINAAGFMYDTPKKRVENKLLERTLDLPDGFFQSYASKLSQVTLEDTNQALKQFIKPERLVIVVLGTASELKEKVAKTAGFPEYKIEVVPYTEE